MANSTHRRIIPDSTRRAWAVEQVVIVQCFHIVCECERRLYEPVRWEGLTLIITGRAYPCGGSPMRCHRIREQNRIIGRMRRYIYWVIWIILYNQMASIHINEMWNVRNRNALVRFLSMGSVWLVLARFGSF